ncbi:alpha/beta fold hydrolase [Streptomyces sp. P6-2-1]|uniref:alpha/beta fold hydrolase n=1 Tax=Streptomyces sp. P6-2-1 TaxID=3422591 RepID=UPI003D35DCDA
MPTPRSLTLRPGLDVSVRETGHGSPVLVLHGGPGPGSVGPLVGHLAREHAVVAPTHPGWEDTVRPEELDSVPALAAAYLDLLRRLDLKDVTVLGTSFGGWVATQTALDDRERRVSRLVLIDAVGPVVAGHPVTAPTGPPPGVPASPAPAGEPAAPHRGPSPASMAALRAYAGPTMGDPGLLSRLPDLTVPVLVLWGEEDTVATPAFGRAYAAAFPDARFALIPGAGHLPLREKPEEVFAALDAFLGPKDPPPATDLIL